MVLRPYGTLIDGRFETGLEIEIDETGTVDAVRASHGQPEPYVLSPAFVNAHSHMEYRGLQGSIRARGYFEWIREITIAKRGQPTARVKEDCLVAATENRLTGVAFVGEHSDRPCSGQAMATHGLDGVIYQEVITFNEAESPEEKLATVAENLRTNAQWFDGEIVLNPHAPWTVDHETLKTFGASGDKVSIHVAESVHENEYFAYDWGPIAEACRKADLGHVQGQRVVAYLGSLGYLRPGVQFVHCCDVSTDEVSLLAHSGVSVAHCPRSNETLDCPRAPVREMLDAGISVGLGLDSAASSGAIDMFAEMRCALEVAASRREDVTPEEVWRMATTMGAQSLGKSGWSLEEGSSIPLIKMHVPGVETTRDLIELGGPRSVEWVTPTVRN